MGKQKSFSDQIRAALADCGLTPSEIAKRSRVVDKSQMSRLMSGERFLDESALNAVAAAAGLRVVVERKGR